MKITGQFLSSQKLCWTFLFLSNALNAGFKFSGNKSAIGLDKTNSTLTLNTSLSNVSGTIKLRNTTGTTDGNVKSATGAETITFSGGSIILGPNTVDLSGGTYDPKTGSTRDLLTLSSGQIMSVSAGTTIYNDVAVANGANATIVGTPTFISAVSLGNSSSVLNLGLQHKLNQDIVLNGGKLVLLDDLVLQDGVRIWGSGTVDVNNQSLTFGAQINSSVFSKDLTFWRAKDITLNGSATLTGVWSFVTNTGDNESIVNGNGNVLTLSGGSIAVGDASAGHTLYISDMHIKGVGAAGSAAYTVPGITKSQYAGIAGLAGATVTAGNNAYDAGFTVLASSPSNLATFETVAIYDDPTFAAPLMYGQATNDGFGSATLNSGPTVTRNIGPSNANFKPIDVDVDGVYGWANSIGAVRIFNGSIVVLGSFGVAIRCYSIGSYANNCVYYVSDSTPTVVHKFTGGTSWNDTWATGYTNIQFVASSSDGYAWVLDNTGAGTYTLTKTNGGTKASGTNITLPENPTTFVPSPTVGGSYKTPQSLAIKGSSTNLYGAYCGVSGTVYTTTDGLTFTSLGNFGATGVGAGAKGTIAFTGPNDSATPNYSTGMAVFVKPAAGASSGFNLYDGGATDANRGKVVLSNVTLELAGNYTHSAGHITFKGDNCKIITGGNKTFNISGSNAPVEVDSVALIYDTLGGSNNSPFTGTAVTLTNGGVVRSAISSVVPVDYVIDANLYNGSSAPTLTNNFTLFGSSRINVTNTSNSANQTVTINGGNYFWQFPGGSNASLIIGAKTTVTLTNVVLKDFSLSKVTFGDANSALVFGDGCVVELGSDQSLTTGQGAWKFSGNATIRGFGKTITLNNSDSIREDMGGTILTIENAILKSLNITSIGCDPGASVSLTNSTLIINQSGFSWAFGNLDIYGYTTLRNSNGTNSGATVNFNITTAGYVTVNTGATLELSRGINLVYSPDTSGDGGANTAPTKRHFRVGLSGDASATLYASNASITASTIGLALDRGNFIVDNKINFTAPSSSAAACEFGSALNVEILAGGVLNLDGEIKYTSTTI